jgi:hypothetical protein
VYSDNINLLGCRPKPLLDELFSSWLIRVAHAQNLKLQTFCHMVWPNVALWNRDCDRRANSNVVTDLADMTGISKDEAFATLLTCYEGILFDRAIRTGHTKWILPLGVFHRLRRRKGLQYCPQCLQSQTPYFKKTWRLSLYTVCEEHQCYLHDACPHCARPIHPHRGEMGDRKRVEPRGIFRLQYVWL